MRKHLNWKFKALICLSVFSFATLIAISWSVATREVQIVKEAYTPEELKKRELKHLKMLTEIEFGKAKPDLESLNVRYFLAGLMPSGYIPPAWTPPYVKLEDPAKYSLRGSATPLEQTQPAKFKKPRHTKGIEASTPVLSNPHPWANLLRAT